MGARRAIWGAGRILNLSTGNRVAPERHARNIASIGMHPGLVLTAQVQRGWASLRSTHPTSLNASLKFS